MKDSRESITRLSAEFIDGLSYEDLDSGTIEFTKRCIIDWMGCVIGGSSTEQAQIIHLNAPSSTRYIGSFSIAEAFNKDGKSLITAIVAGY